MHDEAALEWGTRRLTGWEQGEIGTQGTVIYFVLMAAVIVGADFLFFRHNFQARLIANIAIVLVFAVVYLKFLKRL